MLDDRGMASLVRSLLTSGVCASSLFSLGACATDDGNLSSDAPVTETSAPGPSVAAPGAGVQPVPAPGEPVLPPTPLPVDPSAPTPPGGSAAVEPSPNPAPIAPAPVDPGTPPGVPVSDPVPPVGGTGASPAVPAPDGAGGGAGMAPVDVGAGATPSDNTGGAGGVGEMIEPPASGAFTCPADPGTPNFSAQVQEVAGVPPMGNFGQGFSIIEGAVWTGDALYFSHIATDSQPNPARILSLAADGAVSTFLESSFSNGIALDANGDLIIARHSDGSITRISLPDGAETVIVGDYQGEGFNSPNDIAVRSDGNLYFTDPAYQKPDSRQEVPTRIYHVTAAGDISVVDGDKQAPNGITLSLDENWLYVGGQMPLTRYPVMADGSTGAGETMGNTGEMLRGGDGMGIDCAGNLYVTSNAVVTVVDVTVETFDIVDTIEFPSVQGVTNVAFGGPNRTTMYVTSLGNEPKLFSVDLGVVGRPY